MHSGGILLTFISGACLVAMHLGCLEADGPEALLVRLRQEAQAQPPRAPPKLVQSLPPAGWPKHGRFQTPTSLDMRGQASGQECSRVSAPRAQGNGTRQGGLKLPHWGGRLGNSIYQVVHVVTVALWNGIPLVHLPPDGARSAKDLAQPLGLPARLKLDLRDREHWWIRDLSCAGCSGKNAACWDLPCWPKNHGCYVAGWNSMYRHVLQTIIWPLAQQDYSNCSEPDEATLTIHGRYGDLGPFRKYDHGHNGNSLPQRKLYPCIFYDVLIDTYKFERVIFTAQEEDASVHPCIATLRARLGLNFSLVTSLSGAVCNIVKASNFVAALSSLSMTMIYSNPRVSRIFSSAQEGNYHLSFSRLSVSAPAGGCPGRSPSVYLYAFENFNHLVSGQAKLDYMNKQELRVTAYPRRCLF